MSFIGSEFLSPYLPPPAFVQEAGTMETVLRSLHCCSLTEKTQSYKQRSLNDIANNAKVSVVVENGEIDLPASFKPTTSRYMAPTESAKAKFRLLGSSQNQIEGGEEASASPRRHNKQFSFTDQASSSPRTAATTTPIPRTKSISQVTTMAEPVACSNRKSKLRFCTCLLTTYSSGF